MDSHVKCPCCGRELTIVSATMSAGVDADFTMECRFCGGITIELPERSLYKWKERERGESYESLRSEIDRLNAENSRLEVENDKLKDLILNYLEGASPDVHPQN